MKSPKTTLHGPSLHRLPDLSQAATMIGVTRGRRGLTAIVECPSCKFVFNVHCPNDRQSCWCSLCDAVISLPVPLREETAAFPKSMRITEPEHSGPTASEPSPGQTRATLENPGRQGGFLVLRPVQLIVGVGLFLFGTIGFLAWTGL